MKKRKLSPLETGVHIFFLICGILSVAFVLFISIYLIISGLPAILKVGPIKFLFGQKWAAGTEDFGILSFILTSIYGTAGAVVIGVPLGIMTAVFLAKVAPQKLAKVIHTAVELLAGIPSVVYGLVGMVVLVPAIQKAFKLSSGACLLAAILVLAVSFTVLACMNMKQRIINANLARVEAGIDEEPDWGVLWECGYQEET